MAALLQVMPMPLFVGLVMGGYALALALIVAAAVAIRSIVCKITGSAASDHNITTYPTEIGYRNW